MQSSEPGHELLTRRIQELQAENAGPREKLKQVEKERIEYLQNVSHQLVAPLNAIKWHIENLTNARVDVDRAKKVLRSVYSQATLAVHLAKNFNLMSNLEADHALAALKEPLQEVCLLQLMVNLADDFQPLAWDRDIQIEVVDKGLRDVPPILAMKPLVSQVFSNVIENAVKYSEPSSRILVGGEYLRGHDSVAVWVKNRGIPLAGSQDGQIFERGFRSTEAKAKYPAGTGFGLYIAKKIIEIHDGTISAEEKGGYVTFTATLSIKGLKGKTRFRA